MSSEICSQYNIKQTFTVAYHPESNGVVERTNRKILDVVRPVVNNLQDNWGDWLQVTACINSSINESTGKSPLYILYSVDKRLPYDLLASRRKPVYNIDDYASQQLQVFSDIPVNVRNKLEASRAEMIAKQHKRAEEAIINPGDSVMVRLPERNSKLSPKFVGPRLVIRKLYGNKYEVHDPLLDTVDVVYSDRLKKIRARPEPGLVDCAGLDIAVVRTPNTPDSNAISHSYNLRSRH